MLHQCDIWSIVDFGKGPVEIRCTELGIHTQHRCVVRMIVEEDSPSPDSMRHNIFEPKAS